MISENYALRRLNSSSHPLKVSLQLQSQPQVPVLKKANTLPQRMMQDFMERQQLYEKINRPYQRLEGKDLMIASVKLSKYHKLKDTVVEAKMRFQEQSEKQVTKKEKRIEIMAELMRKQKIERSPKAKQIQQSQKQIDIRILLLIIIPIVFLLTVLIEVM